MGAFAEDNETISYYLNQLLIIDNIRDYSVINCGGDPNYAHRNLFNEEFSENDIIIFLSDSPDGFFEYNNDKFHAIGSLSRAYNVPNPKDHILDNVLTHCSTTILKNMADIIFFDIKANLKNEGSNKDCIRMSMKSRDPYYLEKKYMESYIKNYDIKVLQDKKYGAIVMNCNPFTNGHRYLIEKAREQVEILFVFVVEENRSFFSFNDRFEMVKEGVSDLTNVSVYPSGELMISGMTFSEYFDKENIITPTIPEYDVRVFGEAVAQKLNIKKRFVGEEPFDMVTNNYNETMKRILPEYGVELIEIPRKEIDGKAISATTVRECLVKGDLDCLKRLVPFSTLNKLNDKIEKNKESKLC